MEANAAALHGQIKAFYKNSAKNKLADVYATHGVDIRQWQKWLGGRTPRDLSPKFWPLVERFMPGATALVFPACAVPKPPADPRDARIAALEAELETLRRNAAQHAAILAEEAELKATPEYL
jgi:hypothetical protein